MSSGRKGTGGVVMPSALAVVAPIYRGEEFVAELCSRLHASLSEITQDYRIILVDDASPDDAWARIREEAAKDSRVLGVQLSRNFGQQYAITAGLDFVDADWIVVMDGDLQDRPEDISLLYRKAVDEDFDVVIAERSVRRDPFFRRLSSNIYNSILSSLSGLKLSARYGNFRIMNRRTHQAFVQVREHMRVYVAIMQWIGFRVGYQPTHRDARPSGKSSYNLRRLIRLAVQATVAYSERPLHVGVVIGAVISTLSFVAGCIAVLGRLFWNMDPNGWASLFTLVAFLGGLQILLLGIVGLYVGKTFQETKKRPLYLVAACTADSDEREGNS